MASGTLALQVRGAYCMQGGTGRDDVLLGGRYRAGYCNVAWELSLLLGILRCCWETVELMASGTLALQVRGAYCMQGGTGQDCLLYAGLHGSSGHYRGVQGSTGQ
jgi:hypothetical protein